MAITPVDLNLLEERTANIYEAIIVAAKKARMINDDQRIEYNSQLNTIPALNNEEEGEDLNNPVQMKISLEFENRDKPHIQALKRVLEGKVDFEYRTKKSE